MKPEGHTLIHQLQFWAQKKPDVYAIHDKSGAGWKELTWKQYEAAIREVAKGLIALGHTPGDCVAIVGDNRMDWVICQFGIMAARGIPAPIYATNTEEQVAYIVSHSRADIAICDTDVQLGKYLSSQSKGAIEVAHFVTMDPVSSKQEKVRSLDDLRALGREQSDDELDTRISALTEDETALLIYTSGTTGVPKAVQLTHKNMLSVADGLLTHFPILDEVPYRLVSYLPLCHVAEQMFTNMLNMRVGGDVYFCPDLKKIKDFLLEVEPTAFVGVPRVWEKFQAALEARFSEATGIKAMLTKWARRTEMACFKKEVETGRPVQTFSRKLANKLVISKVKEALGLTKLVTAATGAAPISVETLEFFASIGIIVNEGYGMSETAGVATSAVQGTVRFGSVGKPLPGVTVKIADDGEIIMRGPIMTKGYLHMPEKTAELIDEEGWLHSGDIGEIDSEGYLRITGRKKDLLITAGGKNVAPVEIENLLKQIAGVGQAVVVGDRQPYLCSLLTLDPEAKAELAGQLSISEAALIGSDALQTYLEEQVEAKCNSQLARYQTIKKFKVLPAEFTPESGELTPTMKLKRNVITERYSKEIDAFYS